MVMGRIVGIGGRWVSPEDIVGIIDEGVEAVKVGKVGKNLEWVGVRETTFDPLRDYIAD